MATTPARSLGRTLIPLDGEVSWGCSGQGWNCCVDKDVPVRPYDVRRLAEAIGRPVQQLLDDGIVSLEWDGYGILGGWLATRPYEGDRSACIFYEEVIADGHRVAGLCNAHAGRPEACRAYPYQRHASGTEFEESTSLPMAAQVFDCGSCALAERTTPRQVMLANGLTDYWRADDAYRAVALYLHKCGLAHLSNSTYRQLPLSPAARLALWSALYTSEGTYAEALASVLDAADALIAASGLPRSHLGGAGEPLARPDVVGMIED